MFSGIAHVLIAGSKLEEKTTQVEDFIAKCKRYSSIVQLTPAFLNDLVPKVFVEAPDKSTGKRRQRIHISYNLVGILPPLKRFNPKVVEQPSKESRKGVALRHALSTNHIVLSSPCRWGYFLYRIIFLFHYFSSYTIFFTASFLVDI